MHLLVAGLAEWWEWGRENPCYSRVCETWRQWKAATFGGKPSREVRAFNPEPGGSAVSCGCQSGHCHQPLPKVLEPPAGVGLGG